MDAFWDDRDKILEIQKNFDVKGYLKELFEKYKIKIDDINLDRFVVLYNELISVNRYMNVTRIIEPREICIKHFLDSLLPMDLIPEGKDVVDLGCGGGFPCLPLAIMRPDLRISAIDSIRKKVDYVASAGDAIGCQHNFFAYSGRIEAYARERLWREKFDFVLARAVAPLVTLLEYGAPFLKDGGKMLLYKGTCYDDEIEHAQYALKSLHLTLDQIIEYDIDEYLMKRYVLVVTKHGKVNKKWPRPNNQPRLDPLWPKDYDKITKKK